MNKEQNLLIFNNIQFIIHEARWAKVTNQWKNFVSLYPYNRLYLVTEGEAYISLKQKTLHLKPGNCYFLPAFNVVTANCANYMTHYFIHFQAIKETSEHSLFDYYSLPDYINADESSLNLFQTAVANRSRSNPMEMLYLEGALKILLAPFFKDLLQINMENSRFVNVIKYINDNILMKIKISELAKIMNLTENHFSYVFKKYFNISPKKFILNKKINKAQILLSENFYNIKEIAYMLGFDNEMYFSRLFKVKTKMSPLEYKKQLKLSNVIKKDRVNKKLKNINQKKLY